jgi:symplekin
MSNQSKKSKIIPTNKIKDEITNSKGVQSSDGTQIPTLDSVVDDLTNKLKIQENICDLVIVSMAFLPEQMPNLFQTTYKPIAAAGTDQQIKALARLLAIQLKNGGLLQFTDSGSINGVSLGVTLDELVKDDDLDNETWPSDNNNKDPIVTTSDTTPKMAKSSLNPSTKPPPSLETLVHKKSVTKAYKLADITAQYMNNGDGSYQSSLSSIETLLNKTYNRILNAPDDILKDNKACVVRKKVIIDTTLIPTYDDHLTNYIFQDVRKRIDLGLMWIYKNYLNFKQKEIENSACDTATMDVDNNIECKTIDHYHLEYDKTLYRILFNLQKLSDQRDFLFSRVLCQVPLLTENCLRLLKLNCQDKSRYNTSLSTVRDLISTRYSQRQILFDLLLDFTHSQDNAIRTKAITISLQLHEHAEYRQIIEVIYF